MSADRSCPDGGRCHHGCDAASCFRVRTCAPLSGVFPDDEWPREVEARFGDHYDVTVAGFDFYRQITVRAGRCRIERIVPPAGEAFAFDLPLWDHEITVSVSPSARSVRVWLDGDEVDLAAWAAER